MSSSVSDAPKAPAGVASPAASPPPLQTSTSNDSLEQLSSAGAALQLNVPSATPSASSRTLPSQLHSPAFTAMMASPLASTHHKFPLPGDPGYIKPYVFLGGSCDPTTWRADIAVPRFSKHNIPFFNPHISDWHANLIQLEAKAKEVCDVLLFVIDSKTRAIASMLEAVEYIMSQRHVVIVIIDIPDNSKIDGELIGGRQLKDLNRARAFLADIAARHQKYCDVFDSVESAVNHVIMTHPSKQVR